MATETLAFRKSLADTIGRDFIYVSATDDTKHFNDWHVLHHYAGELFLLFGSGAGKALWHHLKHKAKDLGKEAGDKTWDELEASALKLSQAEPAKDDKKQLQEIETASDAMASLGKALAGRYVDDFLDAGKTALRQRLRDDNFPADKADKIAAEFTAAIGKRIR